MKVCVNCHCEMRCDKNGVGVNFGHGHVYAGDRFKCPECGYMVIVANDKSDYDPNLNHQDEYFNMDETN